MLHYSMPIQRKYIPGKRNLLSGAKNSQKKGWFSYFKKKEQDIVRDTSMQIMWQEIPEDNVNGVSRNMITNYAEVNKVDVLNTQMFRDGSLTTVEFHQQILHMLYVKKLKLSTEKRMNEPTTHNKSKRTKMLNDKPVSHLEDILHLEIQKALKTSKDKFGSMSWNKMFHTILNECNLSSKFNADSFPKSYLPGKVCGHSLQVDLDRVRYNTIHLTLLDLIQGKKDNIQEYMDFIDAILFHNPLWDIGLQHELMNNSKEKIYIGNTQNYTSQCICPCSKLLKKWHTRLGIDKYTEFTTCAGKIYENHINFVQHIHSKKNDNFHKIILRIVQTNYSILLNKLKFQNDDDITENKPFHEICRQNIKLPKYVDSKRNYSTQMIKR